MCLQCLARSVLNIRITQNQQMINRHKRNKTVAAEPTPCNKFSEEVFRSRQKPEQYVDQLLLQACEATSTNPESMNVKQLANIIALLGICLTNKELHQAFIYGSYQSGYRSPTSDMVSSIINLENKKISLPAVSVFLQKYLEKKKTVDSLPKKTRPQKSHHTQSSEIKNHQSKLPVIKTKPVHIFTSQVSKVINIFSQMEKQRQNAGLEPVCLSDEEMDDRSQPVKETNYDGDFFQVNSRLFKLRDEAQRRIEKVIDAAKNDNKLKRKFEQALMRYQKVRAEANEKMGRCGAMKAQKRMIDKNRSELKNLQAWREKTNQTQFSKKYY